MTHGMIEDIRQRVQTEVDYAMKTIDYDESFEFGESIDVTLKYPCGTIEICGDVNDEWQVWIDNTTGHPLPNLHKAILNALPAYEFDFDEAREKDEREYMAWRDTMASLDRQFY